MSATTGGWKAMVVAGSVAAFLLAAKAHGRQLRLERQLEGHLSVTFGSPNHPWVEALWQRERVWFAAITVALAVLALGYSVVAARASWPAPLAGADGRSLLGSGLMVMAWPFVLAFIATGVASLVRLLGRGGQAELWGSGAWWLATVAVFAAVVAGSWRPR
jgi:hypothetical protein